MKESSGRVFSIANDNVAVPGCTISKAVETGDYYISYFSMAEGTDISAESYAYNKLWIVLFGKVVAQVVKKTGIMESSLKEGDLYVTPKDDPVGIVAKTDAVFCEITLKEDSSMNSAIKAAQAFALKDLVPYQEGKIVNMDIIKDSNLKFVIMSFDAGTGLSEHAAPGEALIFALEGEARIGYEGKEYVLHEGENFKFDKMGRHSVTASKRFKMALLLHLEG